MSSETADGSIAAAKPTAAPTSRRGFLLGLGLALNAIAATLFAVPVLRYVMAPGRRLAWLAKLGYAHRRRSQRAARARGEAPATLLPAVHRVASLAKRWLLSTHQGAVEPAHLQSYLDEFVFRFNRRRMRHAAFDTLLGIGARTAPAPYRVLIRKAP